MSIYERMVVHVSTSTLVSHVYQTACLYWSDCISYEAWLPFNSLLHRLTVFRVFDFKYSIQYLHKRWSTTVFCGHNIVGNRRCNILIHIGSLLIIFHLVILFNILLDIDRLVLINICNNEEPDIISISYFVYGYNKADVNVIWNGMWN